MPISFTAVVKLPDGRFKYAVNLGERTYFRCVGDRFCGFTVVSYREGALPNQSRHHIGPLPSALIVQHNEVLLELRRGRKYLWNQEKGLAEHPGGR